MRLKRTVATLIVGVITLFGLGVAANPASASSGDCPSSYTCLWNGTNFSGTPAFKNAMPGTFGACINVDPLNGANNNAESVYNRNGFQVSFYDSANGSGYMFSLAANAGISNINVFPSPGGWGNRISSICHE
jgi:hypothetical protein